MIDWEAKYVANEAHWDRGAVAPPLAEEWGRCPLAGRVLMPGFGPGHDLAWLADRGCDVVGIDIAPTAVALAQRNYPQHAERFLEADLFDLPSEWRGQFDGVVEHTCLSGMPPELRLRYRDAVKAVLKPGGLLLGVWFIDPDLDPGYEGPPFPLPLADLDALFADDFEIVSDCIPQAAFEGREGRERVRVLRRR
ncbi:MAG: methyltransferase domain-containing protein [Verrucomicrobiales bacterium]|nr:methyltransferase domain-containing protein [Verrucomicrobiales bacterium]